MLPFVVVMFWAVSFMITIEQRNGHFEFRRNFRALRGICGT